MKAKSFDCVEMKDRAWDLIRVELANLSREEELAYWQRIADQDRLRREARRPEAKAVVSLPGGD
jgi:hypothetical protein